ncbi:transcription factor CP2-like protein 1 isoform X2 [Sitodiplosis mosellana]|uniref:transcription factor CP2-like protein 1 isoform X2 n=1 Tax=Sitodiplosis mosellana TaxID=263140 RepID=UPI002445171D|nr:transcription factor CP2-like protein 1 isoform X2 [Sitodiplosis mosellana]
MQNFSNFLNHIENKRPCHGFSSPNNNQHSVVGSTTKHQHNGDGGDNNNIHTSDNNLTYANSSSNLTNSNARLGWTDDIDFDYNGDLTNNSYLNNDSFLSLSSALTVLKQEIPSPFGNDHGKKIVKGSPMSKEQVDEISQIEQVANGGKNGNNNTTANNNNTTNGTVNSNNNNTNAVGGANNANNMACHLNGNSNSSASNDLVNCLDSVGQNQSSPNDPNDERNDSNNLKAINGQTKEEKSSEESKFQYVLAAATSIATKNNEETITYLNQGQSYEIKLKKLGDLTAYRGKILKSVIKICFHERRLQYMEREQMHLWQASRPGERIIEIDVPLSYGLCHVTQPHNSSLLNVVEVLWDPMKEVGVYIKINCISTEFTPKKHGGEKGVPFRIQIETYLENTMNGNGNGINNNITGAIADNTKAIHAAACQIKVFKLKGADRKHKQDREKIQKRPAAEKEKYQPSYECTILNDIPNDLVNANTYSPEHIRGSSSPLMSNSPIHMTKFDGLFSTGNSNGGTGNPIGINSVSSTNSNVKIMDQNILSPSTPQQAIIDSDEYNSSSGGFISTPLNISKDATPLILAQWLNMHRLGQYVSTFAQFSGADLFRMSKEDLVQICGLADGIRLYNTLHSKAIAPRLTIYVSSDGSSYHAIYLHANTAKELIQKIVKLPGFSDCLANASANVENNLFSGWNLQSKYSGSASNLCDSTKFSVYINGPAGIHVFVTDEVLSNIKDESLFTLDVQNNKVIMKIVYKNEI